MTTHWKLVVISAVAATSLAGTSGAHAYNQVERDACTGTGQATLGNGIRYFPDIMANVSFTFTFNCADGGSITGSGTLATASCGRSAGSGTINGTDGVFTVETGGSMLVVTRAPDVHISLGNATPIPDTSTIPFGNSCSNGTARVFTLLGSAMCVDADKTVVCNTWRR